MAQNNGADSSKLQQLVSMAQGNSVNQHKTNQSTQQQTQNQQQYQHMSPEYQESDFDDHTMQKKGMGGLLGGPGEFCLALPCYV